MHTTAFPSGTSLLHRAAVTPGVPACSGRSLLLSVPWGSWLPLGRGLRRRGGGGLRWAAPALPEPGRQVAPPAPPGSRGAGEGRGAAAAAAAERRLSEPRVRAGRRRLEDGGAPRAMEPQARGESRRDRALRGGAGSSSFPRPGTAAPTRGRAEPTRGRREVPAAGRAWWRARGTARSSGEGTGERGAAWGTCERLPGTPLAVAAPRCGTDRPAERPRRAPRTHPGSLWLLYFTAWLGCDVRFLLLLVLNVSRSSSWTTTLR